MSKHRWYGVKKMDGTLEARRFYQDTELHKIADSKDVRMVYGPFEVEHRFMAEQRLKEAVERGQ